MRSFKSLMAAFACLVAVFATSQANATSLSPLATLIPQGLSQQGDSLVSKVHRRRFRHCHRRGRRCRLRVRRRCTVWRSNGRCVRWRRVIRRVCRGRRVVCHR